jgi:O-antigen/teichoic acid export membrane protein
LIKTGVIALLKLPKLRGKPWLAKDEFIRKSAVMFLASIIGSICNYLYQIYVGRTVGPAEYGAFGSLFAIIYFTTVFTNTIQSAGTWFISKLKADNQINNVGRFIISLIKRTFLIGLGGFGIFCLGSSWIANFLNIGSTTEVIILGTVIFFSFLLPATSSGLQGLQLFNSLALVNVLTYVPKLLFGVILVSLGYGVSGALGAVTIGMGIAFLFSFIPLRFYLRGQSNYDSYDFREIYTYSIPAILIMICLTVPSNLDVIFAKHYFNSYDVGLYTAASVIGKIIFFLPWAISAVMFPSVSELNVKGKNTLPLLHKSLFFSAILSGFATLIFLLFPTLVGTIFGPVYLEAYTVTKIYVIVMFLVSLTFVIAQYCLAINSKKYAFLIVFFTAVEICLLILVHDSTIQMAQILMGANLLLFLASYIYVIRLKSYRVS